MARARGYLPSSTGRRFQELSHKLDSYLSIVTHCAPDSVPAGCRAHVGYAETRS